MIPLRGKAVHSKKFKTSSSTFPSSDYVSDSSSDDSSSSEDENFNDTKTVLSQADLPPEFWQVTI